MVFFIRFITIMGILFAINIIPWAKVHIVDAWTTLLANISAHIMQLFDSSVISHGIEIIHQTSGKGVRIEAGCNGVEAAIILVSAMFALEINVAPVSSFKRLKDFFTKLLLVIMSFLTINTIANIINAHFPSINIWLYNIILVLLFSAALATLWLIPITLDPVEPIIARTKLLIFKVASILLGFIAIQSLNTLRVICLFYLYLWSEKWFEFAHLYLWPALLIIDAVIVFAYWLYRVQIKYSVENKTNTENIMEG